MNPEPPVTKTVLLLLEFVISFKFYTAKVNLKKATHFVVKSKFVVL